MRLGTERKNIKVHSSQSNFTVGPIHPKLYLYCLLYKRKKLQSFTFSSKALFSGGMGNATGNFPGSGLIFPLFRVKPYPLLHCYESSMSVSDNCSPAAACGCLHPHVLPVLVLTSMSTEIHSRTGSLQQ